MSRGTAERLRTAGRLGAVAACLALLAAGCGTRTLEAGEPGAQPPTTAPAPARPSASPAVVTVITEFSAFVGGRYLLLPSGERVDLSRVTGEVREVAKAPDGWLVFARPDAEHESLWLLRPDRSLRRLVTSDGRLAVAPDGRRLAWREGGMLRTGNVTAAGGVAEDRSTPAPERGAPFYYTGDAVVLGYSETGGGWDRRDVWMPARGGYSPSWNANARVAAVLGIAPDGQRLVGLAVREGAAHPKDTCLALLDPAADLAPTKLACLPVGVVDYHAEISPSRRWLAAGAIDNDGKMWIALIDLRKVFAKPAVSRLWDTTPGGSWLTDRAFLAIAAGPAPIALTRFTVDRSTGEPVALRGLSADESPHLVRSQP